LTFATPARLVSIDTLGGYFSSGASLAVKSLRYLLLSETILEEQLGPERIARVFRLSACKTARIDCAFVILCGSFSKYRANREIWSPEPQATIALGLVGGDFAAEAFTIVPIATVLSIASSLSPFMEQATKVPASR
jgi:hypothetical protein